MGLQFHQPNTVLSSGLLEEFRHLEIVSNARFEELVSLAAVWRNKQAEVFPLLAFVFHEDFGMIVLLCHRGHQHNCTAQLIWKPP